MTEFLFEKQADGGYVSKLPITKGVVQIQFKGTAHVSVLANLPNMPPSVVHVLRNQYCDSVCFELNMPDGVELRLATASEVLKAFYM